MIRVSTEVITQMIEKCQKQKKWYTLYSSTASLKFERWDGLTFYAGDDMKMKDINFILSIKRHFEKMPPIKGTKPDYFILGELQTTEDIVEIDISSAYWQSAYNMGFLTKIQFEKGMKRDKAFRLKALGILAKTEKIIHFDGKIERVKHKAIYNPHLMEYWNTICSQVSFTMKEIASKLPEGHFYFFWVDGIFISKKSIKKVCAILNEKKYLYSIAELKKLHYNCRRKILTVEDTEGAKRPFNLPRNK